MKVLVACECSGVVRDAFIARGHNAMSCDLKPTERPGPHYVGNVWDLIECPRDKDTWDLIIAHPPCTDICVSGARYFAQKRADGRQQAAVDFFMRFTRLTCAWAIENPVGVMSSIYRKPDQIIQPWYFGHAESKATCLWLHRLPKLYPTNVLEKPSCGYWNNQTPSGQNKLAPGPQRATERSRTYGRIADAMSTQWTA